MINICKKKNFSIAISSENWFSYRLSQRICDVHPLKKIPKSLTFGNFQLCVLFNTQLRDDVW